VFITIENAKQAAGAWTVFSNFTEFLAIEETTAASKALVPFYPPNQGFAGKGVNP
jgi:hypothetical protein